MRITAIVTRMKSKEIPLPEAGPSDARMTKVVGEGCGCVGVVYVAVVRRFAGVLVVMGSNVGDVVED